MLSNVVHYCYFFAERAVGRFALEHHHGFCARVWKSQPQLPELLAWRVLLQPFSGDHQH